MEYRKLGHTDIDVSVICLGTMTWGEQNTESDAHEQLNYALENGVNFIDTAELYAVPPRKETYSLTEQYIGNWISKNKSKRNKIILATKIAGKSPMMTWIRDGKNCFDRKNLEEALKASLKRLQTDYIDLYQLHWPDRKTNFFGQLGYHAAQVDDFISIEETLEVLHEFVQKGFIRYIGISNETPWGAMQYLNIAEKKGYPKIVSIQNPYNLLNRTYEVGLAEVSHREQVGLLAYSPLAFGVLSGKYLNNQKPANTRLQLFGSMFQRYTNQNAIKATELYVALAKKYNITPTQMSLAYVNSRFFVTSNIIGATNLEQLKEDIDSIHTSIPKELEKEIEKIHSQIPNPSP